MANDILKWLEWLVAGFLGLSIAISLTEFVIINAIKAYRRVNAIWTKQDEDEPAAADEQGKEQPF